MTLAMEAYFEHQKEILAEDLGTTTEVIEAYLGNKVSTKVYIGGGEIMPCWPLEENHGLL